jgi:succinate dehydrogenase subunit C
MINPTEYVPKSYRPRVSTYWWMARWAYFKFILREVSSVFVAWIVVVTLLQIRALSRGPAEYAEFQKWLASPFVLALNVISFFFLMFHAVTWFNLAPKAMAVRIRGKRLPNLAISAPNYAALVVVSAVIAWIVLRG